MNVNFADNMTEKVKETPSKAKLVVGKQRFEIDYWDHTREIGGLLFGYRKIG